MLITLLLLASSQSPAVQETTLADGRVVRATVVQGATVVEGGAGVQGATGEPRRHGPFEVLSADGETLVKGEYADGVRTGKWRYHYPSGDRLSVGSYENGLRDGRWRFYAWDGSSLMEGPFKKGRPFGKWKVFPHAEAGKKPKPTPLDFVQGIDRGTGWRYEGFILEERPVGRWFLIREDGRIAQARKFDLEGREEAVEVFHIGGLHDALYDRGEQIPSPALDHLFHQVDELGGFSPMGSEGESLPELSIEGAVASLAKDPLVAGAAAYGSEAWEKYIPAVSEERRFGHEVAFLEKKSSADHRSALASGLQALSSLDLSAADCPRAAREIVAKGLLPVVGQLDFGWGISEEAIDADAFRLALLRAHMLLSQHGEASAFWELDARVLHPGSITAVGPWLASSGRVTDWLEAEHRVLVFGKPPVPKEGDAAEATAPKRSSAEDSIHRAHQWLCEQQQPEGHWVAGISTLAGEGEAQRNRQSIKYTAGITALATLSLLRSPEVHDPGPIRTAAIDGLRYLMDCRRPGGQRVAEVYYEVQNGKPVWVRGQEDIYDHAIATQAMAEGLQLLGSPRLRSTLERAVGIALRGCNMYGAWGYQDPPDGSADTSTTFWVMRALLCAESAGVPLDESFKDWALQFVDELTDTATSRVGYNERGSRSARVKGVNLDTYPTDTGETLTAEGNCLRIWLGVDPGSSTVRGGARLVGQAIPSWAPQKRSNDFCYWLAGAELCHELGGYGPLRRWRKAARSLLSESQRRDGKGYVGSWDPTGAWCFAGGRVYATAMGALTLQALSGATPSLRPEKRELARRAW